MRAKNGSIMLLSKCTVCNCKKLKFVKEQETKRLLRSIWIKTPLSQIPLLGTVLKHKMNKIINKFLILGENLCQKCI